MTIQADPVLTLELRGRVALLGMNSPPVNALSFVLRSSLFEKLRRLSNDPAVDAVVLFGHGKGFSAGGDIKEFGSPAALAGPGLSSDLQPLIENSAKPVIAAMHGFALGGGLETALACHYRVASSDMKVGLPELSIGLIPLSGTQRLPRLVGLARAQQLILDAKPVRAAELADTALFDALQLDGDAASVLDAAVQLAGAAGLTVKKTSERKLEGRLLQLEPQASVTSPAHRAAQQALIACAEGDFARGMAAAKHAYESIYALNAGHASARFESN